MILGIMNLWLATLSILTNSTTTFNKKHKNPASKDSQNVAIKHLMLSVVLSSVIVHNVVAPKS